MRGTRLLVVTWLWFGCKAEPEPEREPSLAPNRDDVRADAREGLGLALDEAGLASSLERAVSQVAIEPGVVEATDKLLARLEHEPALASPTAEFFEYLQATPAMRAALADYARANPDSTIDAITTGFVGHVDARLTRAEVAGRLETELAERLGASGHTLAAALLRSEGIPRLAGLTADALADPRLRSALDQRLGHEPGRRAERLHARLVDPGQAVGVLLGLAETLRGPDGVTMVAGILDDPAVATMLADRLARLLADVEFRAAAADLLAQALAAEFDPPAFDLALAGLLAVPAVEREARAGLAELARLPSVVGRVADLVDAFAASPEFEGIVLDALD